MMRNAATTTVAPTGTISIIANCSGGIEPLFSLAFVRNVLRGQRHMDQPLVEVNDTFRCVAEQRGFMSDDLFERLAREGTLRDNDDVPEDVKKVFVCAHDIVPIWHVRMQAAFQQHCDSSISKTINFPGSATPEDVDQIYRQAFELRCKGVTVYRNGCRDYQPMALKNDESEGKDAETATRDQVATAAAPAKQPATPVSAAAPSASTRTADGKRQGNGHGEAAKPTPATAIPVPPRIAPQDLPEIVSGLRIRQMTPFGNMHVKITVDPRRDRELEVFAQLGKGGDVATSDLEAICRMISLWLRSGGALRDVIKQLEGIGSSLQIPTRAGRIMSLGDGLATALKKYTRAKERFGLRSLLLGEIDLAELDNPHRPPHTPERTASDRTLDSERASRLTETSTTRLRRELAAEEPQPRTRESRLPPQASADQKQKKNVAEQAFVADSDEIVASSVSVGTALAELPETETRLTNQIEAASESTTVAVVSSVSATPAGGNGHGTAEQTLAFTRRRNYDKAAHYKLKCPECNNWLTIQEGCRKCHACGWSAC